MRTLTATEASRSFASLLDEAERGKTVVITRGGRRIATLGPAAPANGAEFLALIAANTADGELAGDVRSARDTVTLDGPAWPAD